MTAGGTTSDTATSDTTTPGTPVVTAIHLAPGRRLPTKSVQRAEAEEGRGLVGDRYHGSRHRQVTIQSAADLAAGAAELGRPIDPGLTRRNVTISGGQIPTRPGERLSIGEVQLEVVRVAAPCRLLDDGLGPGAARALHNRGGTVFRLLSSGTIHVGDEVDLAPAQPGPTASSEGPESSSGTA